MLEAEAEAVADVWLLAESVTVALAEGLAESVALQITNSYI